MQLPFVPNQGPKVAIEDTVWKWAQQEHWSFFSCSCTCSCTCCKEVFFSDMAKEGWINCFSFSSDVHCHLQGWAISEHLHCSGKRQSKCTHHSHFCCIWEIFQQSFSNRICQESKFGLADGWKVALFLWMLKSAWKQDARRQNCWWCRFLGSDWWVEQLKMWCVMWQIWMMTRCRQNDWACRCEMWIQWHPRTVRNTKTNCKHNAELWETQKNAVTPPNKLTNFRVMFAPRCSWWLTPVIHAAGLKKHMQECKFPFFELTRLAKQRIHPPNGNQNPSFV